MLVRSLPSTEQLFIYFDVSVLNLQHSVLSTFRQCRTILVTADGPIVLNASIEELSSAHTELASLLLSTTNHLGPDYGICGRPYCAILVTDHERSFPIFTCWTVSSNNNVCH